MKLHGILGGVAAACLSEAVASPPSSPSVPLAGEDIRATQAAVHLAFAARLREVGVTNSYLIAHADPAAEPSFENAAKQFFTTKAWDEWKRGAAEAFSDEMRADFFAGAQVLLGPFDGQGAVFAFFNPWWDALFVVETRSAATAVPENATADFAAAEPRAEEALRIQSFEWLSGETFRRESPESPPSILTVVPEKDPLSVEVWRVQRATLAKFDAVYPPDEADNTIDVELAPRNLDRQAEFERIQVRAGTRLKLLSLMMKSEEAVGVAARVSDLLRSASVVMLKRHFTDTDHEFFCETFTKLNRRAFRSGFVPYGYVPTAEGALYLFVNRDLPRLYATASLPAGLVAGETEKPAIFEWYDLDQAADLLAAWEEEQSKTMSVAE